MTRQLFLLICATAVAMAQAAPGGPRGPSEFDKFYSLGPDSMPREGVAKGEMKGPFTLIDKVFPGVERKYWIYVPASYDGSHEVSLMVFNDGGVYVKPDGAYRAQNVLDNLIYRRDIPELIGVFIDPGTFTEGGKSNRQEEYDTMNDRFSKVITDEILPLVYKDYKISRDPDRHAIAGWSSGAIAAFTVAWERNDQFHKVLNGIGAFVDNKGGWAYADKVAASPKKSIRIFMIDGRNDNRGEGRGGAAYDAHKDFFLQNVRLMEALTKKGYEVNYSWGMGVHSHDMGGAMFPEMLRWLWRDQPLSMDPNDKVERAFQGPRPAGGSGDKK